MSTAAVASPVRPGRSSDAGQGVLLDEATEQVAPACAHHGIIDIPSGPTSQGVFKRCGEATKFQNFYGDPSYWEDGVSVSQVSSGARFEVTAASLTDSEE